uniref:Uncharacterized protein n=1 Tax=Clytia hemisphaerica TaxID=252671 RepID=A0A7M5WTU8_9CNID
MIQRSMHYQFKDTPGRRKKIKKKKIMSIVKMNNLVTVICILLSLNSLKVNGKVITSDSTTDSHPETKLQIIDQILSEKIQVDQDFAIAAKPLIDFLKSKTFERLTSETGTNQLSKTSKSDFSKPIYEKMLPLIKYFLFDIVKDVDQKVTSSTDSQISNKSFFPGMEIINCPYFFQKDACVVDCLEDPCQCITCMYSMDFEVYFHCCYLDPTK